MRAKWRKKRVRRLKRKRRKQVNNSLLNHGSHNRNPDLTEQQHQSAKSTARITFIDDSRHFDPSFDFGAHLGLRHAEDNSRATRPSTMKDAYMCWIGDISVGRWSICLLRVFEVYLNTRLSCDHSNTGLLSSSPLSRYVCHVEE
ncbi:hypothetical protein CC80DRAFT_592772 [Byssothecium circinans]|uniref:60S ribosomal protein L41 n=1 Tax=Byssothecium circinans TaxID=147558 RepID=A0A6A5TY10_9PLEO|nr:hypothetical protein CC80DRAFT_592772 [Byssothecium circinans]